MKVLVQRSVQQAVHSNLDQLLPDFKNLYNEYSSELIVPHNSARGSQMETKVVPPRGLSVPNALTLKDLRAQSVKSLLDALDHMLLKELTPIQAQSIPILLQGSSLIAIAPTGSGKSLSFLIPLLLLFQKNSWKQRTQQPSIYNSKDFKQVTFNENLTDSTNLTKLNVKSSFLPKNVKISAVIIQPTAALVQQTLRVAHQVFYSSGILIRPLTGKQEQLNNLTYGCDVLITNLNPVFYQVLTQNEYFQSLNIVIFDEIDALLEHSEFKIIQKVFEICSEQNIQTAMFSATLQKEQMAQLLTQYVYQPYVVKCAKLNQGIQVQYYYAMINDERFRLLDYLVTNLKGQFIVFFKNQQTIQRVHNQLNTQSCYTEYAFKNSLEQYKLPGLLDITTLKYQILIENDQQILSQFKNKKIKCLLTIDQVCQRGIDIDADYVIHYNMTMEKTLLIHRSGRCGRMGKSGIVIFFCTSKEQVQFAQESIGASLNVL